MPYIDCPTGKVWYEVHGSGPPLLYIHEWNSSLETFKRTCFPAFEKDFTLILFDLPGFGASDPSPSLDMGEIADITASVLADSGFSRAIVMGFCMGSVLALDFAIRKPECTERLILLDLLLFFPLPLKLLLLPAIGPIILGLFTKTALGRASFSRFFAGKRNRFSKMLTKLLGKADPGVARNYLEMLARYESRWHLERTRSLEMPVLLLLTSGSPVQFSRSARLLGRVLSESRLFILPARRHYGFIADPEQIALPVRHFSGLGKAVVHSNDSVDLGEHSSSRPMSTETESKQANRETSLRQCGQSSLKRTSAS